MSLRPLTFVVRCIPMVVSYLRGHNLLRLLLGVFVLVISLLQQWGSFDTSRSIAPDDSTLLPSPLDVQPKHSSSVTRPDESMSAESSELESESTIDVPEATPRLSLRPSWESSTVLPQWLKDYAKWHQEQRSLLTPDNWDQHKYFVLRCLNVDNQCGGASDRLQSVPVKLLMAARHKRILLIYWERPARLEEFLVPPVDGLDWRVPDWLVEKFTPLFSPKELTSHSSFKHVENINRSNETMVETKVAFGSDSGASWYDQQRNRTANEATVHVVFHELWSLLFVPSPPVQTLIDAQMHDLQLQPLQYDALHLRVWYLVNEDTGSLVEDATNCALHAFEQSSATMRRPLYVAGDSNDATRKSVDYVTRLGPPYAAVARVSNSTPHHLDRGASFMGRQGPVSTQNASSLYYDTFVDLYVLSQARCIAYGRGSYGRWANLLSVNSSCYLTYFDASKKANVFPPQCRIPLESNVSSNQ